MVHQKRGMVEVLLILKNEYSTCEGRSLGKTNREEFPTHIDKRNIDVLEIGRTYVCGPMHTRLLGWSILLLDLY